LETLNNTEGENFLNSETVIEGRCADCVLDLLQISGRGPGKYGFCRLRRIVLEYPWAMICQHYQYWGDRPSPGHPRILVDRPVFPLLEYSSQKPIVISISPAELKNRHGSDQDDDIRRNIGAISTAREFLDSSPPKQYDLLTGYLSGFNPYNFVIAVNALHHFPLESFPEEKRTALLDVFLSPEKKANLSGDPGMLADKLVYAAGWALARMGRNLFEYVDSLRLKKHKPDFQDRLLEAARTFVKNPNIKPKKNLISFLFG
jgi:hypothetical protein